MAARSRVQSRPPRRIADRLRTDALPEAVRANAELVADLRRCLDLYAKSTDPDWPLGREINEFFRGDRRAAAKLGKALIGISRLVQKAGIYGTALHAAFPGEGQARSRAFDQWRAALDLMASDPDIQRDLVVRGRPGPKTDLPLYSMCTNVALRFCHHGLKVTNTDPGPLADTLREMIRAVNNRTVSDISPYLKWAVDESRERESLGLRTASLGLVERAILEYGKPRRSAGG